MSWQSTGNHRRTATKLEERFACCSDNIRIMRLTPMVICPRKDWKHFEVFGTLWILGSLDTLSLTPRPFCPEVGRRQRRKAGRGNFWQVRQSTKKGANWHAWWWSKPMFSDFDSVFRSRIEDYFPFLWCDLDTSINDSAAFASLGVFTFQYFGHPHYNFYMHATYQLTWQNGFVESHLPRKKTVIDLFDTFVC